MNRFSKKMRVAVGVIAFTMVAAGAYAYWTGGGTGSGTGTVSSGGTVTLTGVVADGLAPGLARDVTFTAHNASGAAVQIDTVSMDSITTSDPACLPADFTMGDTNEDQNVPTGDTPLDDLGSLGMANTGLNQDACKDATLTLVLSSN
jgi:hypothetical protein